MTDNDPHGAKARRLALLVKLRDNNAELAAAVRGSPSRRMRQSFGARYLEPKRGATPAISSVHLN
jgi:hypothetical protein